jgi:hypothetical protein
VHGAREILDLPVDDSPNSLVRLTSSPTRSARLNVVLVVMESFTGRLTGCLGGDPVLSSEFDKIAAEGVLLEKCYATGERTIQALEATVCSFRRFPAKVLSNDRKRVKVSRRWLRC